jgi:glutaminyl-peptide cyclotransferase
VAILLALVLALACDQRSGSSAPDSPAPAPAKVVQEFDGARAYLDLEALVQIGPRPAGSPGAERTRALIRERLRQAGWPVEAHAFEAQPPGVAAVPMVNLIARREGASAERVLLITHYDTKKIPGVDFVGANDGASGVAVLLELARVLASRPLPLTTELIFADGEEAFGPSIDESDGLYGSTALAERMKQDGSLAQVRSLILVDMVGDKDLNLVLDMGSSSLLRALFADAAEKLGEGGMIDERAIMGVVDDHTPFATRGVEHVLALIDFQFGARKSPGPLWHTAGDDLSAVSAASLGRFGKVLVEALMAIEEHWRNAPIESAPGP